METETNSTRYKNMKTERKSRNQDFVVKQFKYQKEQQRMQLRQVDKINEKQPKQQ